MEEYEKTIAQVVAKREEEKKEFETVKEAIAAERDTALSHLSNMEIAFNDIHQYVHLYSFPIDLPSLSVLPFFLLSVSPE